MLVTQAAMQNQAPTQFGRAMIMPGAQRRTAIDHYRWGMMSILKRTQWTEADVLALPAGEHDYFDRKSGGDFIAARGNFLDFVAKALSAFANSGGGHLILGLHDDAVTFDGLPPTEGRTPVREWLEQKIPNLVAYELQDFRVHEVQPSTPTTIPPGHVVIVIDVGDSALAPHQTTRGAKNYYMRQGGHSVIAPHHYLELLRQRVVGPALTATLVKVQMKNSYLAGERLLLPINFVFQITNEGRIAAYKWQIFAHDLSVPRGKWREQFFFEHDIPHASKVGIRTALVMDPTLLPGLSTHRTISMAVELTPEHDNYMPAVHHEVLAALGAVVHFRVATETSPGESFEIALSEHMDPDAVTFAVCEALGIKPR